MSEATMYEPRQDQVVVAAAPELHIDPRFTQHMLGWFRRLEPMPLSEIVRDPTHTAILSTDLIVGFAYEGRLASPRVAALLPGAAALFRRAHDAGVRHFLLAQDTHSPNAPEFAAWGEHAVRGTVESAMCPELAALPFSNEFVVVEKNSLSSAHSTRLGEWQDSQPEVDTYIVIGDCTDLCVYTAAMHLRLQANAQNILDRRVIVPANLVDTYDMPLDMAMKLGAMPHPGDFFHLVFLYHMALNGIEVVRGIA